MESSTIEEMLKPFLGEEAELYELGQHLDHLEKQISIITKERREEHKEYIKKFNSEAKKVVNEKEWYGLKAAKETVSFEYKQQILISLPRFYRSLFIIAICAVYESSVMNISFEVHKKGKAKKPINQYKNGFLNRAKKFFKQIPELDLLVNDNVWQRIKRLYVIRNVVAHYNGRLDCLKDDDRGKELRRKIMQGVKKVGYGELYKGKGIAIIDEFIIIEEKLLAELFEAAKSSLQGLIERYRIWEKSLNTESK